jgi:hypothetical protein
MFNAQGGHKFDPLQPHELLAAAQNTDNTQGDQDIVWAHTVNYRTKVCNFPYLLALIIEAK